MSGGFRIGKIFGINIRIDWSWFFIFLLVTWNLAIIFGQLHQDWGLVLRWGLALIGSLLFFGSVLAHELAHSLYARSKGVPIRSITLFLFGGVSNIQREPESPGQEFVMAVVGPLTSLVIGAIFLLIGGAIGTPDVGAAPAPGSLLTTLGPVSTILLVLGSINIILGIFNLVPGFPLDGGRVLRSILWGITGNLRRATRWATWVGQAIAWLFIIGGIAMAFGVNLPLLGTGLIGGLWLAFIGWFLYSAATQSYQQVVIQDVLEGVPVSRMMRSNPPTVSPDISVDALVYEHVMQTDDYAFPVIEDDHLTGIVTLQDVRGIPREQWNERTVSEIMTPAPELVTVTPTQDADEALEKLSSRDVRQLPVMDDGHMVGLVRRQDIIKWLQLHSESDFERE